MTVNVSPALLTKNVDAKRRNEELGRNAPELLSCSFEGRVHDLGRRTALLRENHSGMETGWNLFQDRVSPELRENHSGMETLIVVPLGVVPRELRENHSGKGLEARGEKTKISLSPLLVKMGTDGFLTSVPDFRVSSHLLISCSRCSSRSSNLSPLFYSSRQ